MADGLILLKKYDKIQNRIMNFKRKDKGVSLREEGFFYFNKVRVIYRAVSNVCSYKSAVWSGAVE